MADFSVDPELRLLRRSRGAASSIPEERLQHELQNAPLFTHDAFRQVPHVFKQRGLLGSILRQQREGFPVAPQDERIYVNTSAPSSAVVCGVQGSGKSHSVSCLLECSLIADEHIGNLPEPLAGIVFHFDEENGDRPCEAAYLSMPHPEHPVSSCVPSVTVLVSPSNLETRRRVYADLPNVNVQPLYLSESNLNAGRMLSMMGCDDIERMPLYMHTALSILRRMGSDEFNYQTFKERLKNSEFTPIQHSMFKMRTDLLDSYLNERAPSVTSWFEQGKLVIVDLSDPFLDGTNAAILFDIVLGIFTEWRPMYGPPKKVVVLDEAHKYLTNSDSARLTRSISSLIRQQRHLGIRIIISTQEPTVVPATILDLTSFIICHKFSSPSWCAHLKRHVSLLEGTGSETEDAPWFEEVMQLHTGEALLFSSNAVGALDQASTQARPPIARVGVGYLKIQTRPKITLDGGASIMAVEPEYPEAPIVRRHSLPTPSSSATSTSSVRDEPRSITPQEDSVRQSPEPPISRRPVDHSASSGSANTPSPLKARVVDTNTLITPSSSTSMSPVREEPRSITPPEDSTRQSPVPPTSSTINHPTSSTNANPPSPRQPTEREIDPRFTELVKILSETHAKGLAQPKQYFIASLLLKAKPKIYQETHLKRWTEYSRMAESLGIVDLEPHPTPGSGWIALRETPSGQSSTVTASTSPTPTNPSSSSVSVPLPTGNPIDWRFTDLIRVLREQHESGNHRPAGYYVAALLCKAWPTIYAEAGLGRWKNYVRTAETLGLVDIEPGVEDVGSAWVALREGLNTTGVQPAKSSASAGPSSGSLPTVGPVQTSSTPAGSSGNLQRHGPFRELVDLLRKYQDEGTLRPLRTSVAERLLREHPRIYETSGYTGWREYAAAAATSGVVQLGTIGTSAWISLV